MHPGKIIAEVLTSKDCCSLSVDDAAKKLKVHRATLYRLLSGQSSLSLEMAIRLSKLLPVTSIETWMNLQKDYDIANNNKLSMNLEIKPLKMISINSIKNIFKKYKITNC